MEYVKPDPMPDPIVDPSKIKEHNDKYLESLQSGFGGSGSSMGPPTPMGMGPPTPMAMPPTPMSMDLVSTHCYLTFLNHRKKILSNFVFYHCLEFIGAQNKNIF
jgi:hypothetical protein